MTIGRIPVACISAASPVNAGKLIARAFDTSVRNGRHIASTGAAPRKWRAALLWLLDLAIANRQAALDRQRQEIRRLIRELGDEATAPEVAVLVERAKCRVGELADGAPAVAGGEAA